MSTNRRKTLSDAVDFFKQYIHLREDKQDNAIAQVHLTFLENMIADEPTGDYITAARLEYIFDELEKRFPGTINPFSSRPPEIELLKAIDELLAKNTPVKTNAHPTTTVSLCPSAVEASRGRLSTHPCKQCGEYDVYVESLHGDHDDYRITCYSCGKSYCVDGDDG